MHQVTTRRAANTMAAALSVNQKLILTRIAGNADCHGLAPSINSVTIPNNGNDKVEANN